LPQDRKYPISLKWTCTESALSADNHPIDRRVDLELPGTNLTRFNVDVETLKFVDRAERSTQKSLNLRADVDADRVMERIDTIQRESLQRLDDDIELLTKYLKSEGAPAAAIKAVESLRRDQTKSWDTVVARVKELME
jgi:adenylate kinase family enzyme